MYDACSFHSVRSNQQLYNQLQFSVTSNYGSIKKKKKNPVLTVNGHNLSQELDHGQGGLGRSQYPVPARSVMQGVIRTCLLYTSPSPRD